MKIKNMMLRSIIVCSLSQQIVYAEESFKGVFLGIEGGYIFGHSQLKREINKTALPHLKDDKFQVSSQGFIGGGLIEYNHMIIHKFLVGLQVHAKWSKLNGKVNNSHIVLNQSLITDLKMKHSYGVNLRSGYHIDKMLPYITVGLLNSKWYSKTQGMPILGQGSISKNLTGYELGAGVDYSLTKNVVVGAKFSHAWYPKFSYSNNLRTGQMLHKINIKPQTNTVSFNIKWKL